MSDAWIVNEGDFGIKRYGDIFDDYFQYTPIATDELWLAWTCSRGVVPRPIIQMSSQS